MADEPQKRWHVNDLSMLKVEDEEASKTRVVESIDR